MTEPQKDDATKRGDELLRRLLKTPPAPKKPKAAKPSPAARQKPLKSL